MTRRDTVLNLISSKKSSDYIPAAFFMHFDPAYHQGQAAIDKHQEFFRYTGMDFVKIQYEQTLPPSNQIRKAEDWPRAPLFPKEFFDEPVEVVEYCRYSFIFLYYTIAACISENYIALGYPDLIQRIIHALYLDGPDSDVPKADIAILSIKCG